MQKIDEQLLNKRYKPSKLQVYGFLGIINLLLCFIITKIISRKARLFRMPVEIRGRKYIDFGSGLTLGRCCKIEAYPYINKGIIIKFGKNVGINDFLHLTGINSITIGDNVLMAGKIYISDSNHGSYGCNDEDSDPEMIVGQRPLSSHPIIIEDNVWLGEGVSVLSGVSIGRCSIIGAHAVVTSDIPPYTIAVGIPAKPIKKYCFELHKWIRIEK